MPGMDGTGPWGQGPWTGRGLGYCNPNAPLRRGVGFCGWGLGRGRGIGRGLGRGFGPPDRIFLQQRQETLEAELKRVQERLASLPEEEQE
jgi:hypothetical protein